MRYLLIIPFLISFVFAQYDIVLNGQTIEVNKGAETKYSYNACDITYREYSSQNIELKDNTTANGFSLRDIDNFTTRAILIDSLNLWKTACISSSGGISGDSLWHVSVDTLMPTVPYTDFFKVQSNLGTYFNVGGSQIVTFTEDSTSFKGVPFKQSFQDAHIGNDSVPVNIFKFPFIGAYSTKGNFVYSNGLIDFAPAGGTFGSRIQAVNNLNFNSYSVIVDSTMASIAAEIGGSVTANVTVSDGNIVIISDVNIGLTSDSAVNVNTDDFGVTADSAIVLSSGISIDLMADSLISLSAKDISLIADSGVVISSDSLISISSRTISIISDSLLILTADSSLDLTSNNIIFNTTESFVMSSNGNVNVFSGEDMNTTADSTMKITSPYILLSAIDSVKIESDSSIRLTADSMVVVKVNPNGLIIPNVASVPTGENGSILYDSTEHKFKGYLDGAWMEFFTPSTGWIQYINDNYTIGSPLFVNSGDTATVFMNGSTIIDTYKPHNVDSFYNRVDSTIISNEIGATYTFRLDFRAENTSNSGSFELLLDIGGSQQIVYEQEQVFSKGANTEQAFSISGPYYTLATFVANGGRIRMYSDTGNTSMYDVRMVIFKP